MSQDFSEQVPSPPLDYLFSLEFFGIKLGLDNIREMMAAAGNPQDTYPIVHVAGTNGKGSVIAFLDAMLRAAGYRTGRFTSPHLISVNERFLVNGIPIDDATLNEHIVFFQRLCAEHGLSPTFFEMTTAIALRYFAQEKVDIALIEVGMGGRLDSTNIVSPILCAITNIALEHTEHLGKTLAAIAGEKAGIIKSGVPVVTGETQEEALTVITARAKEMGAELYEVDIMDGVELGLGGEYQRKNAAIAVRCAQLLQLKLERMDHAAIIYGLENACWPCRLERVSDNPPIIIDVAHNPAGAKELCKAIERCVCVLAVSADKDAAAMIEALAPCVDLFLLSVFQGNRAMPVEKLAHLAMEYKHESFATLDKAIMRGLELAREDLPLLITGSIFTAGEARKLLIEMGKAKPIRFV